MPLNIFEETMLHFLKVSLIESSQTLIKQVVYIFLTGLEDCMKQTPTDRILKIITLFENPFKHVNTWESHCIICRLPHRDLHGKRGPSHFMPLKTGLPFPKQHDVWLKPNKTVQLLWMWVKGMDLCSFPLIWSSCPLRHLIFKSGDCITFHFTIFLCLLLSTENSALRDPVRLNTFMHSWHRRRQNQKQKKSWLRNDFYRSKVRLIFIKQRKAKRKEPL